MNSPEPASHMAPVELDHIPINAIRPSGTPIQALRRARFSAEGLLELAASIKVAGVIEPIIVRPLIGEERPKEHIQYELVAGERRWLAADRAGLAHVPAIVRTLTAAEVLTTQLIENKQREDYTPLEEGQGYKDLMDLDHLDAEAVGARIGKSRAHVYARRKLLDLVPQAREALQHGVIDASKALIVARLPEKLQEKALELVRAQNWKGEPISYKTALADVREKCMKPLAGVPWLLDDATLYTEQKVPGKRGFMEYPPLPACTVCPHYSGNDPELRADLGDADVCTNVPCFEDKIVCVSLKTKARAEQAGTPILTGDDAKKIAPRKDKLVGFIDLDDPCEWDEFEEPEPEPHEDQDLDAPAWLATVAAWEKREVAWQSRTYRQLLGDQIGKLAITLLEDPKTKRVRELVPLKMIRPLLAKQHEIKLPGYVGKPEEARSNPHDYQQQAAAHQRLQAERLAREERELVLRQRIMAAIAAKCIGPFKREDLVDVADALLEKHGVQRGLPPVYGGKLPEPSRLKDPELAKLIRLALVAECTAWGSANPGPLLGLAKRYKIDVAKIKVAIAAEEKAKAKATEKNGEKTDAKK